MPEPMQILYYKALWGMTEFEPSLEVNLRRIKAAGYDGVEFRRPDDISPADWRAMLREFDLRYIAQIFAESAEDFERELAAITDYDPEQITSHSGRDKMTLDEGCRYFDAALRAEERHGIPVAHETHRYRLFFTPWTTAQYLERFPTLNVCADFSHWCCVCESRLGDMDHWIEQASRRAIHLHARVGHEEGPQVSDPRAPEFAPYVELHETWWDRLRHLRAESGSPRLTVTPEYGPPHYQSALPHTRQPIADIWEIALWTADRLRSRWK